jgi:hypothetical protein
MPSPQLPRSPAARRIQIEITVPITTAKTQCVCGLPGDPFDLADGKLLGPARHHPHPLREKIARRPRVGEQPVEGDLRRAASGGAAKPAWPAKQAPQTGRSPITVTRCITRRLP